MIELLEPVIKYPSIRLSKAELLDITPSTVPTMKPVPELFVAILEINTLPRLPSKLKPSCKFSLAKFSIRVLLEPEEKKP